MVRYQSYDALARKLAFTQKTRVQFVGRHTRIANAFKSRGFLALSHNTSPRSVDFAPGSPEDNLFGPRAAGVIVVVSDKHAGESPTAPILSFSLPQKTPKVSLMSSSCVRRSYATIKAST